MSEAVIDSAQLCGFDVARWIWVGKDPRPINTVALFRRTCVLEAVPKSAAVLIYAEWRYRLFVNGRFVQVGPTPCQPTHRLVDRIDVTPLLRRGENAVAIAVYTPGVMTGQWTLTNPALRATLVVDDTPIIPTDASWRGVISTAWHHPTQFCGYAKGFHEWHVRANLPQGWTEHGFDDTAWSNADELRFFPTGLCEENYVGYPTLTFHRPTRYLGASVADGVVTDDMRRSAEGYYVTARNRWWRLMGKWHSSSYQKPFDEPVPEPIAERMHREQHAAAPPTMVLATDSPDGLPLHVHNPQTVGAIVGHPTVIFDFGIVRSGLIRVEIESESGGTVDIGWDDRMENGRVAVARSTPNADRVELPPGRHEWISLFERGLRYLQLTFRDFRGEVVLCDAGVAETLTPVCAPESAVFESSNDLLNRIWRAASETVRLYMNGCAAGDPVRERAHWLGDDGLAMRAAYVLFGEEATWRRALELTAESQNPDGSLPVVSPGHFEDENMVSGSCSWAVSIAEYVRTTGDTAFGHRVLPHIRRHIDYERRFADANGLLYETPGRRFLSWADGDPRPPYALGETWQKHTRASWGDFFDPPTCGWNAIINAYWLWCLRECADLARALGSHDDAHEWSAMYEYARAAFDAVFFVPDTNLWRDNVAFNAAGRENEPTYCESTIFTMMRAGLLDRKHGLEAIGRLMDTGFVCCRTSGGLEGSAYPTFLTDAGCTKLALEYWLDRWGAPIMAGATTCGEEFFQSSGNSDCHIHGAGPARDFIEYLAGIRIRCARWSEVVLVPPVNAALLPDLRATIPTPHGTIDVCIETDSESTRQYRWSLPDGVCAKLRIHSEEIAIEATGSVPLPQPPK